MMPLTCTKYDKRLSTWKGTAVYCHNEAVYRVRVVGHPNLSPHYRLLACRKHLASQVRLALLDTPGRVVVDLALPAQNDHQRAGDDRG